MTSAAATKKKVVFCQCAYTRILPKNVKHQVRNALDQTETPYEEVEDLCRLAAHRDPALQELVDADTVKIAACYPRAVKWIFHSADIELDDEKVEVLNMREQDSETVVRGLLEDEAVTVDPIEGPASAKPEDPWKPWFPVIDFDRCTNCMQCLSFCLFDVYGVSDQQKIQVKNPTKCKTDCPACSRVCPEAAILFPKYRSGPINGAEVSEEDLRREKMQVDISSLLGGNIYQMLRDRTEKARSRFSKERDEERALKERKRCMKKLQETLDIPDEVMNALPSLEQIQSNAAKRGFSQKSE